MGSVEPRFSLKAGSRARVAGSMGNLCTLPKIFDFKTLGVNTAEYPYALGGALQLHGRTA